MINIWSLENNYCLDTNSFYKSSCSLFCFILISWGCTTSLTFYFCNEPIWLAHCKKKFKLWRLPKIKDSMERWSASPFWPSYIGEKGRNLGKHMGLKYGVIGNNLGECIGNLGDILGTWWELIGNLKERCWEQRKNEKNPPPYPNLKRWKIKAIWMHTEPSHWLHKISISNTLSPFLAWANTPIINHGYLLVMNNPPWKFRCNF